jgi:hypothetical protein
VSTNWVFTLTLAPALWTLPSSKYLTPSSRPTSCAFIALPLYVNEEVRAITKMSVSLDRALIRSSVMPSTKKSCSAAPLRLAKGSTATEELSNFRTGLETEEIAADRFGGCNH